MSLLEYHDVKHFKCNGLKRWKLRAPRDLFSVRVHHWVKGDPPQYQHAHPWNFLTIVLWGGYNDIGACASCDGSGAVLVGGRPVTCKACRGSGERPGDCVRAPCVRYRPHTWRHSVINCLPHTWTIVITGRAIRDWRFWIGTRQVNEQEWNLRPCD